MTLFFQKERGIMTLFFQKGRGMTVFCSSMLRVSGALFGCGGVSRSYLGRLSVIGRWNKARYKRGKRDGNLNKSTFL